MVILYKDDKGTIECRTFSNVILMQKKEIILMTAISVEGKNGAGQKN